MLEKRNAEYFMRRHGTHDTLKKAREGIRTQKGIFKKEGGPKRIFFWGAAIRRSPKTKTKEKEKGKSMGRSHMAQPGEKDKGSNGYTEGSLSFQKI